MRPTVGEQLAGIDRLLEQIGADPAIGSESALLLRDARRQLGRLRGSLDLRLPFLRWDNAASLAVLQAIAPRLPADFGARLAPLASASDEDEHQATERNDALRTLLGEALDALAEADRDTGEGRVAHRLIVDHLRARVAANPALNKNPTIPDHPRE